MAAEPLPPGWRVRVSRAKGKVYYYHERSQRTQWVRPSLADDPPAAAEQQEKEQPAAPPAKRARNNGDDDESRDVDVAAAAANETRAAIARSMRVGGSAQSWSRARGAAVAFAPWEHQLAAVECVLEALQAQEDDTRVDRFLLQHSTGAGKTLTLAALAYQLLYAADARGARFHTVVVMIDRVKLDEQVGNTVEAFLRRNGIDEVFRAESIGHLAALMDNSATAEQAAQRVIVTTTHKMGLLVKDEVLLARMLHRASHEAAGNTQNFSRVAIITDEAHRSHTAATRETIEKVMRAGEGSDRARITFVGFTATPNTEALHLFGTQASGGALGPLHCYPISQATADGRIKNVLENYKCLRFNVETTIPSEVIDALRDEHALRDVLDHASDDVAVLKGKAALMMQDFLDTKKAYKLAKLNLATSDIVIVCDKLDTGYNDPRLSCMYIDRYLRSSSQTVQLTSRLNRLHKDKPHVHIIDFSNHAAQIRRSFATFWDETRVQSDTGDVDVDAELADATTGHTILCDFFPALWENPHKVDAKQFARSHIVPLERDSFHQVLDALRLCCSGLSRLQSVDTDKDLTARCPVSYDLASRLKKAVESEMRAFDPLPLTINMDEIKSKMAARISSYRSVFSGELFPDAVLRLKTDAGWDRTRALELQERGPLESFEAAVRLSGCLLKSDDKSKILESLRGTAARIRESTTSEEFCNPLERQIDHFIEHFSSM